MQHVVFCRDWQLLAVTGDNNIVTPDTNVLFLICHYSFVFVVDMTASVAAVVCKWKRPFLYVFGTADIIAEDLLVK